MPRLISCAQTIPAILDRSKTVTRRLGLPLTPLYIHALDLQETPITLADDCILTTRGEVRRIGHGQWIYADAALLGGVWIDAESVDTINPDVAVIWRPTPPRTVTIELTENDARRCRDDSPPPVGVITRLAVACRDALEREP